MRFACVLLLAAGCATATTATDFVVEADPDGGANGADGGNGSCAQGFTRCSANFCTDLQSDSDHCGACDNACPVGQVCTKGKCGQQCPNPPNAAFSAAPLTPYVGQTVTFTPAQTGLAYKWTFPGGTPASSTDEKPTVTWAAAGKYAVKLETTLTGCAATQTVEITIAACPSGSQTFEYTGQVQTFVNNCATALTVDAYGAQGGSGTLQAGGTAAGGLGGRAQATIPVVPGETLNIYVGGAGVTVPITQAPANNGGFNGGGSVLEYLTYGGQNEGPSGSGGGASDVRRGTALTGRLVVAGGGGGGGYYGAGGAGGGANGVAGSSSNASRQPGSPGTQTAGGTSQQLLPNYPNTPGQSGIGGNTYRDAAGAGAGGGGYFGGGAGLFCGGGGGSAFVGAPGTTNATVTPGVRSGHGRIVLSW